MVWIQIVVEVGPNDVVLAVKGGIAARADAEAAAKNGGHEGRRGRYIDAGTAGVERKIGPVGALEHLVGAAQFIPEEVLLEALLA